jgi:hypothetical protein
VDAGCDVINKRSSEDAMTLTLNLPAALEQRLTQEAASLGVPPEEFVVQLLVQHLSPEDRRAEFVALLRSWRDGDAEEQKETGEYLVRVLDEDRSSQRKLFPPELKGKTW